MEKEEGKRGHVEPGSNGEGRGEKKEEINGSLVGAQLEKNRKARAVRGEGKKKEKSRLAISRN